MICVGTTRRGVRSQVCKQADHRSDPMALQKIVGPTPSCSLLFTLPSFSPLTPYGETDHFGTRQAPECLDSIHISVRSRELLKAPKQRFYICPPLAEICPRAISTYNTAGRRETIVSTCSPLLNRSMIKVSTQYAVNLVGILVAGLGRSEIKLLFSCTSDFGC